MSDLKFNFTVKGNFDGQSPPIDVYPRKFKLGKGFLSQPAPETVSSGQLVVGDTYIVVDTPADGDDFSNAGGDVIDTGGENGGYPPAFKATATTPANWTGGTQLKRFPKPVLTLLENDLGGEVDVDSVLSGNQDPVEYEVTSNGLFTPDKTVVKGTAKIVQAAPHTDASRIVIGSLTADDFGQVLEIEVYP